MTHQRIDQRSLAFGRLIVDKLRQNPALIEHARSNLRRWRATCSPRSISTLDEWQTALDGPIDGVIALLTSGDEQATRLRQSNPFAGVLTDAERNDIIRRYQDP